LALPFFLARLLGAPRHRAARGIDRDDAPTLEFIRLDLHQLRKADAMAARHGTSLRAALLLSLLVAICGLAPTAAAQDDDIDGVIARLPRAFVGDFRWSGGGATQEIAIRFDMVRRLDAGHAEALGCGTYDAAGHVAAIRVRMLVTLVGLKVEIWESDPDRADFVTDGSHRGSLGPDLRTIEAEWTTASTGARGHLRLQAAPAARCAPTSTS